MFELTLGVCVCIVFPLKDARIALKGKLLNVWFSTPISLPIVHLCLLLIVLTEPFFSPFYLLTICTYMFEIQTISYFKSNNRENFQKLFIPTSFKRHFVLQETLLQKKQN